MVVEHHLAKGGAGLNQLLAQLAGPVVSGLQKDQVRPVQPGQQLGEVPEIAGIENFLSLGLQLEGVAAPGLPGLRIAQVAVVESFHPQGTVQQQAIGYQPGLQGKDGFIVSLAAQQHFAHPFKHV